MPANLKSIAPAAFTFSCIKTINLPENLERIEERAFQGCNKLVEISFPESLQRIDDLAFLSCQQIPSVYIPAGTTYLGKKAFVDCAALTDVTIGQNVATVDSLCFSGCKDITTVTSLATTAPAAYEAFEAAVYDNAQLRIPAAAAESYRTADCWENFLNRTDTDGNPLAIEPACTMPLQPEQPAYDLYGRPLVSGASGIAVVAGRKVVVKNN